MKLPTHLVPQQQLQPCVSVVCCEILLRTLFYVIINNVMPSMLTNAMHTNGGTHQIELEFKELYFEEEENWRTRRTMHRLGTRTKNKLMSYIHNYAKLK